MRNILFAASAAMVFAATAGTPAFANSTFPYTCSNTSFEWNASGQPTIQSTCLQANGSPHATSLVLMGISNQNGRLTQGTGASTFQQSCGSIKILIDGPIVTLSAYCRSSSGSNQPTSLSLNNIGNMNGNLTQQ
ncbi:MAG: cyanovirin containing protein [Alphaproteobacteria bacterium]|nr:cyanovirin containing protein [Alphaproteobacteria bacterium]MBV9692782.1 cyanovirin containing protein [Alphaproteobacteria bacterium]